MRAPRMARLSDASNERRRAIAGGLSLLALAAMGAALAAYWLADGFDAASLETAMRDLGPWGPVAIIALMIIHCFIPFPAELAALGAGALFGMVAGAALVWVGAMLGAALSFALALWLGRPFVAAMLSPPALARIDAWTQRQGATSLLAARLAPVIAFNLVNYAAGMTGVRWPVFLWTTAVGILPATLICAAFGAFMRTLDGRVTAWLIAAAVVTVLAGWLLSRARPQPKGGGRR